MLRVLCALLPLLCCVDSLWHTTFCVVTSHRQQSYLSEVVAGFVAQNALRMDGARVVVVDVDNSTDIPLSAPLPGRRLAVCDTPDVEGIPSCKDRQLSLDVTAALSLCDNGTTGWVVMVEDDCVPCEGAVDEVNVALSGLNAKHTSMARFSKFLRATAFPAGKIARFREYVLSRLYTHPHDVTKIEDWDPPGSLYVHHRNLFHHIGNVSTVENKNTDQFREMYSGLREDVCCQTQL